MLSSVAKKQIVAITGLMLIGFLVAHLAGNLFIYWGPDAFNAYADKLAHLRPALTIMEYGLLLVFISHIVVTAMLVIENIKARGGQLRRYAVENAVGKRSWSTRLMPYSGTYILFFILWHLFDFTFSNHSGVRSFIGGKSYGLYGVVVNAFADPMHSILYIIAICFLGLHLAHGVESLMQTMGYNRNRYGVVAHKISQYFALLLVLGFSSMPVYVLFILTR